MNKAIIKYGVFFILLVMSVVLPIILNSFEVYSKTSVNLIVQKEEVCIAYVEYNDCFNPVIGDTLTITQTIGDDIRFILEAINREPSSLVLKLYHIDEKNNIHQKFGGNTFSSGYIFVGRMKLLELIKNQFV